MSTQTGKSDESQKSDRTFFTKLNLKISMKKIYDMTKTWLNNIYQEFKNSIRGISIEGINWTALLTLQTVLLPSLLGLMSGLTDDVPPIDIVLILYAAMALLYIKAILEKNVISLIIIGAGFIGQSVLMALIFFK
jgi:hypothetical protein